MDINFRSFEAYKMDKSLGSDLSYIASSVLFLTSCLSEYYSRTFIFLGAIVLVPLALIIFRCNPTDPDKVEKSSLIRR